MTVATTTARNDYVSSGIAGPYPFTFAIKAASHLVVTRRYLITGAETTLVQAVDYTLAGTSWANGGSFTLAATLATGYALTARRVVPLTQLLDLRNQGAFFAEDHESEFDLLTQADQQQQDQLDRSLKLPTTEVGTSANTTLPAAGLRANKALIFDSSGNPTVGSGSASTIPDVSLMQVVDTIAALNALAIPSGAVQYFVRGYYAANDGGGGVMRWNAASAATDDGGSIFRPASLPATGRWERILNQGTYNIREFGAKGDGSDDLIAINAAITAANAIGGGVVVVPPGTFTHSAAITMKALVIIRGAGKTSSTFKSSHAGDGITMTSPINSSTAVHTAVYDLQIWNTNGANTGAGYDDVGGTFVYLHNVRVRGFAYGIIFDQTELGDIFLCDMESQITAGIWLLNGSEHTASASSQFTNRIAISKCQINEVTTTWGIIDDGGTSHAIYDNNFNGCSTHLRISGTQNLQVRDNEFESALGVCILMSNLGVGGGAKGASVNTLFAVNAIIPTVGNFCITIVSGSPITFIQNLFGNTTAVKINGVSNSFQITLIDNFNAGGGATYTSSSTHMVEIGSSGLAVFSVGNGAAIKAHLSNTAALSFGAPGAVPGAVDLTVAVTGAAVGDPVDFGPGVTIPANYVATAWVSAAGTVTVRLLQFAGAATAQNLGTCRVGVWQH